MYYLVVLALLLSSISCRCSNPPPAAGFTIKTYQGKWYQIAKYQTAGGAYFQKNCTCTEINVSNQAGTITAYQSCVKNGKITGVNATLIPLELPGKFIQKISLNKVGYWVIELDEDTAIEYDCGETLGVLNYCVHIMSRKTTMSSSRLEELVKYALGLGLNQQNLNITITDQKNCPGRNNLLTN